MPTIFRVAAGFVVMASLCATARAAEERAAEEPARKSQPLITISKETTYLTEPLTEDGYVDYVEALNRRMSEGVTTENNAAVLFWKALGPKPLEEPIRKEFFDKLGIPYPSEEGEYFLTFDDFAEKELGVKNDGADTQDADRLDAAYDQEDRTMDGPWKADQCPLVAAWLTANERPLRLLVEGTRRPRYYCPLAGEDEPPMIIATLPPGFPEYRDVACALRARAMLKLGSGKIDAAWQDLLACHRLARLMAQGPTLVDCLVATTIDALACEADQLLVYHGEPSAEQAAAMVAGLQNLPPPLPNAAEKVDLAERFFGLDAVASLARQGILGGGDDVSVLKAILNSLAKRMIDWDAILRRMNRWYDRFVAALSESDRDERQAAMDRIEKELTKLAAEANSRSGLAADILTCESVRKVVSEQIGNTLLALLLVPNNKMFVRAQDRAEMTADLTAVSLALAGYHTEHGSYPDRLAALAPQYFREVPTDRFTGAPLHYRREGQGYLLYSVGPNQKDDRGQTCDPNVDTNADDITIRVPPRKAE